MTTKRCQCYRIHTEDPISPQYSATSAPVTLAKLVKYSACTKEKKKVGDPAPVNQELNH